MLYVTTRGSREQYPALRTLGNAPVPDGGVYLPFRQENLVGSWADVHGLSFGESVAKLLNSLFLPRLTGAMVDFTVGKAPVRLKTMNHRIAVAECWHNPRWEMHWMVEELLKLVHPGAALQPCSEWGKLAVRMAVLCALLQQLEQDGMADREHPVDLAVRTGDFSWPMAAYYVRQLGLPVGTVICASEDSSALWDLTRKGELRTKKQETEPVFRGMERLICACLGQEEAARYGAVCARQGIYTPPEDLPDRLWQGLFAGVIGASRMGRVISNVYRTNGYMLSRGAALAYAGLQDYRSAEAEGRLCLVMMERSPAADADTVAPALGLSAEELRQRLE